MTLLGFQVNRKLASHPQSKAAAPGCPRADPDRRGGGIGGFHRGFIVRRMENGRSALLCNACHPERENQTGIGPIKVQFPKTRAKDGSPVTFQSTLLPPYERKTRSVEAALPWLCLKGVSSGEIETTLEALVGPEVRGLSASTVARLTRNWAEEYAAWRQSRLDKDR